MDKIRILFTGDFCPHNRIENLSCIGNFSAVFNDFMDVFAGNDLNVTDLECPLTDLTIGRSKIGPLQKANPNSIRLLQYAGIGLAAMSNNHIMDYGEAGASQTLENCKFTGIATVGIGTNEKDARRPFILHKKGQKIAILNFADNEFLTAPHGIIQANPINEIHNFYDIQKARLDNDRVIVIIHGGNEFYNLPSPRIKELYRYYVDIGADAIISHHTHRFSGYEVYNGKPIFYGLGNFIYDWPKRINSDWNIGFVVRLNITKNIDFDIIPLKQGNDITGVFHLNEQEKKTFHKKLESLNSIIATDFKLEQEFQKYCESVYPMYDAFIEPYFGKVLTAIRKRGLFPKLMSKRKRLLLLNIIRCASHRDVLLNLLKKYE
ncbi:MAG: CapA family protein [Bacteroidetes bacterium]|nr:CapA family protein [Bacteroidota bacterium]